jgi:hypothetical protein
MIQTKRTPYNELPITVVSKAVRQKSFRQLHCIECGLPIADITDKVVVLFDDVTPVEKLVPDVMGIVEIHCGRHHCKQYYRLEFSK